MTSHHHVALGGTGWLIWRDALLRSTGFPASGLLRFATPECAAAADAHLAGADDGAAFRTAFAAAVGALSTEVNRVAADPLLREAITWQSPAVVGLLDSLLRNDEPIRRNAKRRYREEQLSRFWQRYCGKTETIGFFGPSRWISVDPAVRDVTWSVGRCLTDRRRVFLEPWAVLAYGDRLADDPEVRVWLPPARQPHHHLDGRLLHRPSLPPVTLTEAEAAVLAAGDGRRTAVDVAAEVVARGIEGLARTADVYDLLADLATRKLLTWNAHLPLGTSAEPVLRERIAAIGDVSVRERAAGGLRRLTDARDRVAAAAGDPSAVAAAIAALDEEFTVLTGRAARRHSAVAYAGRGLCYEDTTRDLRMSLGSGFLDDLAPALDIVLRAARWLTGALARTYGAELAALCARSAVDGRRLTLGDIWYRALGLFMGAGRKPSDRVLDDFVDRWAQLLGLDDAPPDARDLRLSAADLAGRAAELFPTGGGPGWSAGRVHSPDLQICARSPRAVNEGDYLVVLGELHVAVPTMEGELFGWPLDDPGRITELAVRDYGTRRLMPLLPQVWPRNAGRLVPFEPASTDRFLGFATAPGADLSRTTPVTAVPVTLEGGEPVVTVDGEQYPLVEAFSAFLSIVAADAFKVVSATGHTPRITLDRLVLFRETWRTSAEATGLLPTGDEAEEFLAARRWRTALGLPDRCFVKLATEAKPLYVDLTSPLYVSALCASLRAAHRKQSADVPLTVTEMLPEAEQAWVPGGDGERYFGELRFQITDPHPLAATTVALTTEDAT